MARRWLAGWKLFREEDPTTATATQYQPSGGSSGGAETPEFISPTSYEGHFQSPLVLPTPQSEQRQTDQEIQSSLIEASNIWVPSVSKGQLRSLVSSKSSWSGGIVWIMPAEEHFDPNTHWAGFFAYEQIAQSGTTHWGNDIRLTVWGGNQGAGGVADETVNQNSSATIMLVSGVPDEALTTGEPRFDIQFSHTDNVPTTRMGTARFELVGDGLIELSGITKARDLIQTIDTTITGAGSQSASLAVTYDQSFSAIPHTVVSTWNSAAPFTNSRLINASFSNRAAGGGDIECRHVDNTTWSFVVGVTAIAVNADA